MDFNVFMENKLNGIKKLNVNEVSILLETSKIVFRDLSEIKIFNKFMEDLNIKIEDSYKGALLNIFLQLSNAYSSLLDNFSNLKNSKMDNTNLKITLRKEIKNVELKILGLEAILDFILTDKEKEKFKENLVNLIFSQFIFMKENVNVNESTDKSTDENTDKNERKLREVNNEDIQLNDEITIVKVSKNTYRITKADGVNIVI
jgi:hypothetical protein